MKTSEGSRMMGKEGRREQMGKKNTDAVEEKDVIYASTNTQESGP